MVQPTSARPSDAAVVADTRPETAAVAMSDQGATVTVVVIAGGPRMRGRGTQATVVEAAMARAERINTVQAVTRNRVMRGTVAAAATARAGRINTVQAVTRYRDTRGRAAMATAKAGRLNTRIIPPTAAMAVPAGDRTLNVTVAVVKVGPGNLRADSLPVAVASVIAQVADALAGDASRSCGDGAAAIRCRRNLRR
jgi:hypothetical protein